MKPLIALFLLIASPGALAEVYYVDSSSAPPLGSVIQVGAQLGMIECNVGTLYVYAATSTGGSTCTSHMIKSPRDTMSGSPTGGSGFDLMEVAGITGDSNVTCNGVAQSALAMNKTNDPTCEL